MKKFKDINEVEANKLSKGKYYDYFEEFKIEFSVRCNYYGKDSIMFGLEDELLKGDELLPIVKKRGSFFPESVHVVDCKFEVVEKVPWINKTFKWCYKVRNNSGGFIGYIGLENNYNILKEVILDEGR